MAKKKQFIDNNGLSTGGVAQTLPIMTLIGANTGTAGNPHYSINDFIM